MRTRRPAVIWGSRARTARHAPAAGVLAGVPALSRRRAEGHEKQDEAQCGEHPEHDRRAAGQHLLKVVVLRRSAACQRRNDAGSLRGPIGDTTGPCGWRV